MEQSACLDIALEALCLSAHHAKHTTKLMSTGGNYGTLQEIYFEPPQGHPICLAKKRVDR